MSSVDSRQLSDPASGLPEKVAAKCAGLLSGIWTEGVRHFITLHVAAWCAHSGYGEAAARRLIAKACELAGDPHLEARLKAVSDTYGKPGSGTASLAALREVFRESLPKFLPDLSVRARRDVESTALTVLGILTDRTPAPKPARGLADFRILKIVKFVNTDPMMVNVTFEKKGRHLFVGTVNTFFTFAKFQRAVREQLGVDLADIGDDLWHTMISYHRSEMRRVPEGDRGGKP